MSIYTSNDLEGIDLEILDLVQLPLSLLINVYYLMAPSLGFV